MCVSQIALNENYYTIKQVLKNEPMPQSASAFRETICGILDWVASMPDRVKGYFEQTEVDLGLT